MKRRILVVDDTPMIRDHLRVSWRWTATRSRRPPTAARPWSALRERPFHLLITDLRMPDIDGIELLAAVRAERLPSA